MIESAEVPQEWDYGRFASLIPWPMFWRDGKNSWVHERAPYYRMGRCRDGVERGESCEFDDTAGCDERGLVIFS
jgi:hypothetical protein